MALERLRKEDEGRAFSVGFTCREGSAGNVRDRDEAYGHEGGTLTGQVKDDDKIGEVV